MQRAVEQQRAQADVHRKLAAIFASPIQLQSCAHRASAWGGGIPLTVKHVGSPKAFGQQGFQRLAFEFGLFGKEAVPLVPTPRRAQPSYSSPRNSASRGVTSMTQDWPIEALWAA